MPTKNKNESTLSTRAMLVDLSVSVWEGRKKDNAVANEVTNDKKAEQNSGTWWTSILPRSKIMPILSAINKGHTVHFKHTLPWSDTGTRILPAEMFLTYTSEMRKVESEFHDAVSAFVKEYPTIVHESKQRLGELHREDWFPKSDDVKKRYRWNIRVLPLPQANDFRVDLADDQTKAIQQDIEARFNDSMQAAMKEVWERLHEQVAKMAERLADPEAVLRKSLVANLAGLCEILPKLNIVGDKRLDDMRHQITKQLAGLDLDGLKEDKAARANHAKKANEILKTMTGFMGKEK